MYRAKIVPNWIKTKHSWVPNNNPLPNMLFWLRSDYGLYQDAAKTIPAQADGDAVGAWSDKSGNGHDALIAIGVTRPILKTAIVNGKPVIRFNDIGELVMADFDYPTTALSFYAVVARASHASFDEIASHYLWGWIAGLNADRRWDVWVDDTAGNRRWHISATQHNDDEFHSFSWTFDGSVGNGTLTIFVDNVGGTSFTSDIGILPAIANPNEIITISFFCWPFHGDMAEIIFYEEAHNALQRAQMHTYFSNRYGV